MKITKIQVWDFTSTFRDGPFVQSHVTQDAINGRILRVETENGLQGLGEIVFAPTMTSEERQQRILDEDEYLPPLIEQDIESITNFTKEARERGKTWCGVAFGLETAYFDILARSQGQSMADLLGSPRSESVNGYHSISERSCVEITERLAMAGPERKVVQLKLGIGSVEDDTKQIAAALDAMSDTQTLLADANGGWSADEAKKIMVRFDDPRLIWEEPCRTYDDNIAIARTLDKPVMLDQCVGELSTAIRAAKKCVAAAICIKPAFLGGLSPARRVRDICADTGMRMRIDGPWCGDIATAAILHMAVGAPPDLLIAGADLRMPLIIEPDLNGVVTLADARIAPPYGVGLGIELSQHQLGDPEVVYQS